MIFYNFFPFIENILNAFQRIHVIEFLFHLLTVVDTNFFLVWVYFSKSNLIIIKSGALCLCEDYVNTRKFFIRRNNKKVDSTETGRIVIAHLIP